MNSETGQKLSGLGMHDGPLSAVFFHTHLFTVHELSETQNVARRFKPCEFATRVLLEQMQLFARAAMSEGLLQQLSNFKVKLHI